MSKRRNRHKKIRARAKAATSKMLASQLAPLHERMTATGQRSGSGPAYRCGSYKHDGLTPLKRAIIRDATSVQHMKAQGEVQSSHMIVQEPFGWQVHAYNPQMPNHEVLDGKIRDVDTYTQSKRWVRDTRSLREQEEAERNERLAKLRRETQMRNALREAGSKCL